MATKTTKTDTEVNAGKLIEKLGIDPKSDAAIWIRQQQEDGVKDADILYSLANSDVTPAKFRRVARDD